MSQNSFSSLLGKLGHLMPEKSPGSGRRLDISLDYDEHRADSRRLDKRLYNMGGVGIQEYMGAVLV